MSDEVHVPPERARERLRRLLSAIEVGMLATRAEDGTLRSRPMRIRHIEEGHDLWFLCRLSSRKVSDLGRDPHVNLSFVDLDGNAYVSVAGTAHLVDDKERVHALWSDQAGDWFPEGPDDPDIVAVRVDSLHAEYWDDAPATDAARERKAEVEREFDPQEHAQVRL